MSKTIQLSNGNKFEVEAVQLVGRLLDSSGNPIDSGNSLVSVIPSETTMLPEGEIIEQFTSK